MVGMIKRLTFVLFLASNAAFARGLSPHLHKRKSISESVALESGDRSNQLPGKQMAGRKCKRTVSGKSNACFK